MGRLLLLAGAAIGGLAIWRRKTLKSDAEKVTAAAKDAASKVKGGSDEVVDLREAEETAETGETEATEVAQDAAEVDEAAEEEEQATTSSG